jgi:phage recombination protein Bet
MTELAVIDLLPSIAERSQWTEQQKAVMESLGLRGEKNVQRNGNWVKVPFEAPDSIVEAFRYQVQRTGLDPVARQIYAIERGGKWGIQISIDGFRLIAERSKEYRGQTPAQWTDGKIVQVPLREDGKVVRDGAGNPVLIDDYRWVDAWVSTDPPAAARVGVYRDGFAEPMWAVAVFDGYAVRDRNDQLTGQWKTNPANQLAKCAEMLALRKAYPQGLSGLYGTEEMDQAGNPRGPAPAPARASAPVVATIDEDPRDWGAEIAAVDTVKALTTLYSEAQAVGAFAQMVGEGAAAKTVEAALWARKAEIEKGAQTIVDVEPEKDTPRDWLAEAKATTGAPAVIALYREALALDADEKTLTALTDIAAERDTAEKSPLPAAEWAQSEGAPDDWDTGDRPAVLVDDASAAEPEKPTAATKKGKG